ncbi:MAG: SpoIIE family protein phosphatase [Bacteroidales bacterium]|nr:SpoIIE family protein phosphatase [Bacteroidales bacterium]
MVKYLKSGKKYKKQIDKVKKNLEKEIAYLQKEIERQNFLINQLKNKNTPTKNTLKASKNIASPQNNDNADTKVKPVDNQRFEDKNKKLWELSLALHKEKEKIDRVKKEIEFRHNEVTKSITYAQRIQKALLPGEETFKDCRYEHFIFWSPRDIVSGDFYWLKQIGDYTAIVVADCTGHGVPGAFMSVLGISFLNDIFGRDKIYPAKEVLEKMRLMMKNSFHYNGNTKKFKSSDGIDMALAIINNKTLELDFSGANNPLYIIRNNELIILKATRNPIGNYPFEKPFESEQINLQKGDRLYMFSDGFIDQFGGKKGRKFLKKNFQRLLLHIAKEDLPMEEEKDILSIALHEWIGKKYKQVDDILVLGMKI